MSLSGDTIFTGGANMAMIFFRPFADWNGETTFSYAAIDGDGVEDATPASYTIFVDAKNDEPTGAVTIGGDLIEDATLTASSTLADGDGLSGPISYQWRRNGENIPDATGETYTLGDDDVGAPSRLL